MSAGDYMKDQTYGIIDNSNNMNHPLVNFNFMLRVEGVWDLPCKSVHSFTKENEFENIQEGGLNDYIHLRRKPITKPFTFTVERYAMVDAFGFDPLHEGAELTLPIVLLVGNFPGKFDKTRRAYVFTGCTVMSKEYGELDAEKSGLLIERTVIAYRELMTVSVPWDNESGMEDFISSKGKNRFARPDVSKPKLDKDKRKWEFDEKNYLGKGDRSRKPDESKPKLDKDKRKWSFDEKNYEGSGKSSRRPDESKEKNPEDKRKWQFDEGNYEGKGKSSRRTDESKEKQPEDKRKWQFDEKNYEGKGKSSRRPDESTAKKAEDKRKWLFEEGNYKGKGKASRRPDESKPLKESDIRRWQFDENNYLGKGTRSAKKES